MLILKLGFGGPLWSGLVNKYVLGLNYVLSVLWQALCMLLCIVTVTIVSTLLIYLC